LIVGKLPYGVIENYTVEIYNEAKYNKYYYFLSFGKV